MNKHEKIAVAVFAGSVVFYVVVMNRAVKAANTIRAANLDEIENNALAAGIIRERIREGRYSKFPADKQWEVAMNDWEFEQIVAKNKS